MKKTFLIAFICFIFDQLIKVFLINFMDIGESIKIVKNFFSLSLVLNNGAAFSILSSHVFLLIIISITVLIFICKYICSNNLNVCEYIIFGFLMGGICGNLIDRIMYGAVVDYLDFKFFNYNFPIFNFADICIVLSMFSILFLMVKDGINDISSK